MRNKEVWTTILSLAVLSFLAGLVAGVLLLMLQPFLYIYMDYMVGDLLREDKSSWSGLTSPYSWRDYGVGIIISIDENKETAKIYWFEIGIASIYKFESIDMFLQVISSVGPNNY